MKSLQSLALEKISPKEKSLLGEEFYRYLLLKYTYELFVKTRERHLFNLIRYYYVCRRIGGDSEAYYILEFDNIPRWKLIQWCACEVVFGRYHNPEGVLCRIRLEMPFEHENGRSLEYTVSAFENALAKHCPDNKGNVHDWIKVFCHVPTKILMYEDFFG